MLSGTEFIRQSLELHLFFARIMKEHSFFLQIGFMQKDSRLRREADEFRMDFDRLLADVVDLSNGVVSKNVLRSCEIVTPFTAKVEKASACLTGVDIPIGLTRTEEKLVGGSSNICDRKLEERVCRLNERAIKLVSGLIDFKTKLLSDVLYCRVFTANYPLLIDHILREAKLYRSMIQKLQSNEKVNLEREAAEQEVFWNRIMAEHSKFIRGLLDPTEEELINIANNFGNEFDELTEEAKEALDMTIPISEVTEESLDATREIRQFKTQATEGLINCQIRSIIIPLLGDHTLREANHYLRLLKIFEETV
ncbi:DUF2935 domain-containing protein [Hathewaya histolytica]|uniref:DUF2935 domain-containing protein n=1 Tax=Hathewaya histolytica TaxID=1498 RepID=UPI003B6749C2